MELKVKGKCFNCGQREIYSCNTQQQCNWIIFCKGCGIKTGECKTYSRASKEWEKLKEWKRGT